MAPNEPPQDAASAGPSRGRTKLAKGQDVPNLLFLMCDQMQGLTLAPDCGCRTPNLDRLAAKGVRFTRSYTPNAICSPARASLMTGLLPHNHGVLTVTHTVDDDQCCLRTQAPHWAQHLSAGGYRTGYFGKWHVERSFRLDEFGWQRYACESTDELAERDRQAAAAAADTPWSLEWHLDQPPGYERQRFYGAIGLPAELRRMGVRVQLGLEYLDQVLGDADPWCCFVSLQEPHDPFVCGTEALAQYDIDAIELSPSAHDDLAGRPGIYRVAARVWAHMTDRQRREATACYYASITEIDQQMGRLIDRVGAAGQLDNTVVVFTSDHGELLGAHGLYCKNFSGSEEIYHVPLIVAGPGVAAGAVSDARVGHHDLCQTLLELTGCEAIDAPDSRSFAGVLRQPEATDDWQWGYAEYFGARLHLSQRVIWDGDWKYVFNGYDEDELYDRARDPWEMDNRIADPACTGQVRKMCAIMWERCRTTGDRTLLNSQYPILRVAPYGPEITK